MEQLGLEFLQDEALSKHTTYRIGGAASFIVFPKNIDELKKVAEVIKKSNAPYYFLGNGSNLLVADEGFDGVIIKLTKMSEFFHIEENNIIHMNAGMLNARALRLCADKGLAGIEYLCGVPGTLGAAVIMNAGTAEGWIEEHIIEVNSFSLSKGEKKYQKNDMSFSYRKQHFLSEDEIVLDLKLQLIPDDTKKIKARLREHTMKRKAAQPIEMPSCGSVFRNPEGSKSWKLIADAGLRGKKIGGARISEKHCNFIVNEGGAKMGDVLALIQLAKETVKQKFAIELQEEVVVLQARKLI